MVVEVELEVEEEVLEVLILDDVELVEMDEEVD